MSKGKKLKNIQHEAFCHYYVLPGEFFGNGVQAYAKAYNIKLDVAGQANVAHASASRLLKNVTITKRINELLDKEGFNAEHADKRLLFWMNQNNEPHVSMKAIVEFNKLKQRITEKIEHEITSPVTSIIINPIPNGKKTNNKEGSGS